MEGAISDALKRLSAGDFQRLTEAYAEVRWAGRYDGLVPGGRNPFSATTAGWPDAWATGHDGGLEAIEATRGSGWSSHLDADIEKVSHHSGSVRSFVFVTAANQPKDETLRPRLERLIAAGIPKEKIDLVFRQRLCRDLAAPRFARVRADLLKLPPSPSPFVALDRARSLFSDGSPGAFGPTKEEYAIPNRVWSSKALAPARQQLEHLRWACVEGGGASGKTVLCTKLGLEWIAALRPAYYADMASIDGVAASSIIEAMTTYGDQGVLFVVDNIHLAEATVGALFDNWRSREDGSSLLLSGRETSGNPWSGTGDKLHDIRRQAVRVRPGTGDVYGTYRRLVARRFPGAKPPPRFLTRRWAALFRGDLVAFAVALVREHAKGRPFGELSAEDAVDYVRDTYLASYASDDSGIEALLAAAALSVLEIPAPVSLVPPDQVRPSLRSGVLLRTGETISAAHPGLARLLLAAADREEIDVELLLGCAAGERSMALPIAMRLFRLHEIQAGEAICRLMVDRGEWSALLPVSLDDFTRIAHVISGVMPWEKLDQLVVEETNWAEVTPKTSLSHLVAAMELCGGRMPRCSAALGEICFPDGRPADWLLERLLAAGPTAGARFAKATHKFHSSVTWQSEDQEAHLRWVDDFAVKIAAHGLDRSTWKELRAECESPEVAALVDRRLAKLGIEAWMGVLSRMPAQRIRQLLKLELPEVSAIVADALEDKRLARAWIGNALEVGGVDDLTRRMFRAREALPDFHREVGMELAHSGDAEAWVAQLLGDSVDIRSRNASRALGSAISISLASAEAAPFVARADEALVRPEAAVSLRRAIQVQGAESLGRAVRVAPNSWPLLNARLVELAADNEVASSLARELCNSPLSELRLMLVDHPLAVAVLANVAPEMWALGRPVLESGSSYVHFPAVASGMSRLEHVELARPLANSLGEAILRGDVPRDRLYLPHVSHLLRLIPVDAWQLRQGLESLFLANGWPAEALLRVDAFAVTQALYSLWCYAPEFAKAIPPTALGDKLAKEMNNGMPRAAICLLGSISLIYEQAIDELPDWLDSAFASGLLGWDRWQSTHLLPGAAQALLGLRAAAVAGADLRLPVGQLKPMLDRCRASAYQAQRHGEIAGDLAGWLEVVLKRGRGSDQLAL
jgi:hypothetical protein